VTDCADEYSCYVDVEISGEWVSGDCEELAAYFNIDLNPEPKYGDQFADDECVTEEVIDCLNMVKYFVEGAEECTAFNYINTCEGDN